MLEKSLIEIFTIPFQVFLIIVLVAVGIYFSSQSPIRNITKAYTEMACAQGGLKSSDYANIDAALQSENIDPTQVTITITPAIANNITSTTYATRGTIINLVILNNKLGLIDTVFKKLGNTQDIKNRGSSWGMSEKY
jgi:hypothetical protein